MRNGCLKSAIELATRSRRRVPPTIIFWASPTDRSTSGQPPSAEREGAGRIARLILFTRENAPLCGAFSLYFTISLVAISASLSLNPDLLRAAGVCLHVDLF